MAGSRRRSRMGVCLRRSPLAVFSSPEKEKKYRNMFLALFSK
jgi:hypothetical protein